MTARDLRTRSRHFHVPARELLFDVPELCPYMPGLAMVGVAVTETEQHRIILDEMGPATSVDRFYLGPTQDHVGRRSRILAQALRSTGLDDFHVSLIQQWVCTTWESLIDALVEGITGC